MQPESPHAHPNRRRNLLIAGLVIAGIFIVAAILVGIPLIQTLMRTFEPVTGAFPTTEPFTGTIDEAEISAIGERLGEVGLEDSGILLSTGIEMHLQRLRAGEIGPDALRRYADHLAVLHEATAAFGDPIPTTFWDVQTVDMRANNLTEYAAAEAMTMEGSSPYLKLLARSYNRLVAFKQADADDTALNAAFDNFQYVVDYYEEINGKPAYELDAGDGYDKSMILVWQQVMFSTSRINPLNGESLVSHSIYNHFNITDMWRYRIGENAGIGEIWGVSGFAPRFVGDAANDNQVEHTTISMTLQLVLGEPLTVLNLIEDRDMISGRESATHAAADIAINTAIAEEFAPRFKVDYRGGIEHLRCVLSGCEA